MRNTFKKTAAFLTLSSFFLQFAAFAVDPVKYGQLSSNSEFVAAIEKMVEKRAEHFMSLSVSKQIKLLERADRHYDRMLARIARWSEEKFQRKIEFAKKMAGYQDAEENDSAEFVLSQDEKDFFNSAEPVALPAVDQNASVQSKAALISNLRINQESIKNLKSELLRQVKLKGNSSRAIASNTATKAVLTAVFAILIVAGVFAIIFGLSITVATLGILAPLGITLVTIGAVVIIGGVVGIPIFWIKL